MNFVDTNVVVYAYDVDEPKRRKAAGDLLSRVRPLVISSQVLREFYAATRRLRAPLSHEDALGAMRGLTRLRVQSLSPESILKATEMVPRWSLSIWDAMIVRAAIEAGCQRILTEDMQDGAEIEGVRIENPFAGIT